MKRKSIALLTAGAVALIAVTAGASTYIASDRMENNTVKAKTETVKVTATQPQQQRRVVQERPAAQPCDDGNIVGKIVGGTAGGVVGSQFGKGNGKTAATIGGAVGGTVLGGEYIPTKNIACR